MDATLFHRFCRIAYTRAGIDLKDGKEALVAARVAKRIRRLGLADERQYLRYLEKDESGQELVHFLDVISTNFTSFFREPDHFEFLTERVKEWAVAGQRRFRFWSAASSSGEEPYSIAITVSEALARVPADYRILATDISTRVLAAAQEGIYPARSLDPVPKTLRTLYFVRSAQHRKGEREPSYQVSQELRDRIVFKRLNLAEPPFPITGPLDIVFCRNVMIYFDHAVRQRLVAEIERVLRSGGYLLIGHTETLTGLSTILRPVRPSIYLKP